MPATAATLRRLLRALEELGRREDGALATGDGIAYGDLELRTALITRRIADLIETGGDIPDELRRRGQALAHAHRQRQQRLVHLLETTRDEIGQLDAARQRARQLRPAYLGRAGGSPPAPAFAACG